MKSTDMILKVHPVSIFFFFLCCAAIYLCLLITRKCIYLWHLLGQAAYNVGGQSVNAQTIQNSILGCQSHRPSLVRAFAKQKRKEKNKQTKTMRSSKQNKLT